jgi:hypothetical protein
MGMGMGMGMGFMMPGVMAQGMGHLSARISGTGISGARLCPGSGSTRVSGGSRYSAPAAAPPPAAAAPAAVPSAGRVR